MIGALFEVVEFVGTLLCGLLVGLGRLAWRLCQIIGEALPEPEDPQDIVGRSECVQWRDGVICRGSVEDRAGLDPSGPWLPRCEKHHAERLALQQRIVRTPGSS